MNDIIDDDFMDVDVDAVAAAIAMSTGGQVLAPSTMNGHEASVAPPATSAATSPSRMSTGASPGKTAAAAAATRRRSRASTAETGVYAQFMDRLLDRLSGKRARKSDGKSATNDASTATSEAKMTTISADIVRVLEHAERRGKRKLARAITGRLSTGVRSPVGATSSTSSHLRRVLGEAVAMSSMAATCKSDVASSTTKPVPSLDPRFTAGHALSSRHAVSSLKPTFTLQLYAHHFKLANYDGAFSYDGPMRVFVDAVDEQVLVPDLGDLLEEAQCPFYDGIMGCALTEFSYIS